MSTLQARPLRRYARPSYPTKLETRTSPRLLEDHVPRAWANSSEIATVLGVMLSVQAAGCSGPGPSQQGDESVDAAKPPWDAQAENMPAIIAPLFEHGDGLYIRRGMLGCIAIAAPVYLSEEEAVAIITDELAAVGLSNWSRRVQFDSLLIAGTTDGYAYDWLEGRSIYRLKNITKPLVADLVDEDLRITIEFISSSDIPTLAGHRDTALNLTKDVADAVNRQVADQGKGFVHASFYDPGEHFSFGRWGGNDERFWESPEEAEVAAERQLRAQVKDFIDWLQGQGEI